MSKHIIETEETLIIETPERLRLELALASIGKRFLTVAVDRFIQYFIIFLIAWVAVSLMGPGGSGVVGGAEAIFLEMPKWTVAVLIIAIFLAFAAALDLRLRFGRLPCSIRSTFRLLCVL